jgi:hypothetical protein
MSASALLARFSCQREYSSLRGDEACFAFSQSQDAAAWIKISYFSYSNADGCSRSHSAGGDTMGSFAA